MIFNESGCGSRRWKQSITQLFKENIGILGLQRDVVFLGWPLAPSYTSPTVGGGGSCGFSANEYNELRGLSQWVHLYTGAQINFSDLTPYLTYEPQVSLQNQKILLFQKQKLVPTFFYSYMRIPSTVYLNGPSDHNYTSL